VQAIILLQNNYRVDSGSQISLVAHVVDGRETVKLRGPEWGVSLPLPRSWAPDSQVHHVALTGCTPKRKACQSDDARRVPWECRRSACCR